MLSYEAELRDHARRLFEDSGALHTVAVLGFDEEDPEITELCLEVLSRAHGAWTYLDLRSQPEEAVRDVLRAHLGDPAIVLVTRRNELPTPALRWVSATLDRALQLELGDQALEQRRRDQSLVVVVHGAAALDELAPELQRAAHVDLIP